MKVKLKHRYGNSLPGDVVEVDVSEFNRCYALGAMEEVVEAPPPASIPEPGPEVVSEPEAKKIKPKK